MRVLGIDPGTTRIGIGVVNTLPSSLACVYYGTIESPGKTQLDHLIYASRELHGILDTYTPEAVSIERLFFSKNQKTAMAVSEIRGVLILAAAERKLPVFEFSPTQVKQAVCGYGAADKQQVQKMVRIILNLASPVQPDDAADALALAICGGTHALRQSVPR